MADGQTRVRRLLQAHPGHRTNSAGTRIACTGCRVVMDLAVDRVEDSKQEVFIEHLLEAFEQFTDRYDKLAGPPF